MNFNGAFAHVQLVSDYLIRPAFLDRSSNRQFTACEEARSWGWDNIVPGRNGLGGGSILGDDGSTILLPPGQSARVNASYLQPFFSYTAPSQTTFTLQTGSTYNWTAHQWTVPVEGGVSQVLKIGSQPISVTAMAKYWAVRPDGAPSGGRGSC